MSKEAVNHYSALTSDITAFRHYMQSERGLPATRCWLMVGISIGLPAGWRAAAWQGLSASRCVRELSDFLVFAGWKSCAAQRRPASGGA